MSYWKMVKLKFKIIWSNNILLPKVTNIMNGEYSIGYSNRYKNYTYRFYPYISLR